MSHLGVLEIVILAVVVMVGVNVLRRSPRLGALVLALLGLGLFFTIRTSESTSVGHTSSARTVSVSVPVAPRAPSVSPQPLQSATVVGDPMAGDSVAWKPEVDEKFLPDVYPSKIKAVQDLGRQTKTLLLAALSQQDGESTGFDSNHRIILRTTADNPVPQYVLESLQASLTQFIPGASVAISRSSRDDVSADGSPDEFTEDGIKDDANVFRVEVALDSVVTLGPQADDDIENGTFAISVDGGDTAPKQSEIKFVHAPWVSEEPGETFLVVRTPEFASSAMEAEAQLVAAIATHAIRIADSRGEGGVRFSLVKSQRAIVVPNSLGRPFFVQGLQMESGDHIYRAAAKIDRHDYLASISSQVYPRVRGYVRDNPGSQFRGIIGLLATVVGVFVSLKAITARMTKGNGS